MRERLTMMRCMKFQRKRVVAPLGGGAIVGEVDFGQVGSAAIPKGDD